MRSPITRVVVKLPPSTRFTLSTSRDDVKVTFGSRTPAAPILKAKQDKRR